jgi:hypothetical protein
MLAPGPALPDLGSFPAEAVPSGYAEDVAGA